MGILPYLVVQSVKIGFVLLGRGKITLFRLGFSPFGIGAPHLFLPVIWFFKR
jgi:hypothetical protein